MARYFFDLVGMDQDDIGYEYDSTSDARNAAVTCLAEYLRDYPDYAHQGHWQVDVYDDQRKLLLHVIVATVDAEAEDKRP